MALFLMTRVDTVKNITHIEMLKMYFNYKSKVKKVRPFSVLVD